MTKLAPCRPTVGGAPTFTYEGPTITRGDVDEWGRRADTAAQRGVGQASLPPLGAPAHGHEVRGPEFLNVLDRFGPAVGAALDTGDMSLIVELSDEALARLEAAATTCGVSVEELAAETLSHVPAVDGTFARIVTSTIAEHRDILDSLVLRKRRDNQLPDPRPMGSPRSGDPHG